MKLLKIQARRSFGEAQVEEAVNRAGYLFFTDADAFHTYVLKEILANSALDSLFS